MNNKISRETYEENESSLNTPGITVPEADLEEFRAMMVFAEVFHPAPRFEKNHHVEHNDSSILVHELKGSTGTRIRGML